MPLDYNLPWNQSSHYWLVMWTDTPVSRIFKRHLHAIENHEEANNYLFFPFLKKWEKEWHPIYQVVRQYGPAVGLHASLVPGEERPDKEKIRQYQLDISSINRIANNLWLGEALLHRRLHSYMQPVVDKYAQISAHEAFARIVDEHGKLLDAATIFNASKNLGTEDLLDQHLQIEAIRSYKGANMRGKLFINMLPSLVHKPEKYLYGFTHTLEQEAVSPKDIVLDVSGNLRTYTPRQIQLIHEYAASLGCGTALDDVASPALVAETLRFLQPDYVKIDIHLTQHIHEPAVVSQVQQIVKLANSKSVALIAEGVEEEGQYLTLKEMGVQYFQGYYFGHPEPINEATLQPTSQAV